MSILFISAAICFSLLMVTILFLVKKKIPVEKTELMRLAETKITGVLGILLIVFGFFILYMKYNDPAIAGTDQISYLYIAGFALLSAAFGCGILFFTFLRKVVVYEDGFLFISLIGKEKKILWKEITEIKTQPLSNKATFIGKTSRVMVGGEPKAYKAFLKIAMKNIKPEVGSDTISNLLNRSLF